MRLSFCIQGGYGAMDGGLKGFCICEGLMGKMMGFKIMPDSFDVVQFWRVFR